MSKRRDSKQITWSQYALRIFCNSAAHPIEYAKVLIQIGHEPIAPRPTTTFFGKPALKLPNIFEYVKYIKSVDGLVGCYRGMVPKVCANVVSAFTTEKVVEKLDKMEKQRLYGDNDPGVEDDDEDEEEPEPKKNFFRQLKRDIISRVAAIIASQPFHVIAIRMMAQFVGKETQYNGMVASVSEVYKQNGVLGFFSGLVPRVIGDVIFILLASSLTYAVNTYVTEDTELQSYTSATMSFIACAITYPFQVVSNCMVVTNSGLEAGHLPRMPHYHTWIDCWSDLSRRNQLKRGSSVLIRYYVGPQMMIRGKPVPISRSDVRPY